MGGKTLYAIKCVLFALTSLPKKQQQKICRGAFDFAETQGLKGIKLIHEQSHTNFSHENQSLMLLYNLSNLCLKCWEHRQERIKKFLTLLRKSTQ